MGKFLAAAAVSVAFTGLAVGSGSVSAGCHGDIVGDIASTWPFAHEDRDEFSPPPGAIALYTEVLTPFDNPGQLNEDIKEFCDAVS